ncbi:MAG: porin [Myxococcota bacterium]
MLAICLALTGLEEVHAQDLGAAPHSSAPAPAGTTLGKKNVLQELNETLRFYGALQTRLVFTESGEELQDGASRIGISFRRALAPRRLPLLEAFGKLEFGVNLVDNSQTLTLGDSTSSEILSRDGQDAFETRLGFLGLAYGNFVRLSFGKQWSVYYDVAGWTDKYYVFGSTALGVFSSGTDGGGGSGRADQAIQARFALRFVDLGLQYQVRGLSLGDGRSFGASLRARPTPWLEIGGTFVQVLVDEDAARSMGLQLDNDPRVFGLGVKLDYGGWILAFVYGNQAENELGSREDQSLLIGGNGYELYARVPLPLRLHIYGGFNLLDSEDQGLDEPVDVEHYYLGVAWDFHRQSKVYLQARRAALSDVDALVFGLHYDFEAFAGRTVPDS